MSLIIVADILSVLEMVVAAVFHAPNELWEEKGSHDQWKCKYMPIWFVGNVLPNGIKHWRRTRWIFAEKLGRPDRSESIEPWFLGNKSILLSTSLDISLGVQQRYDELKISAVDWNGALSVLDQVLEHLEYSSYGV